jgi:error-prone DNA polymerase
MDDHHKDNLPIIEYAELHCLSNFTFLRGASHPEELVERAAVLGYKALALTDECSLSGVVRAHTAARAEGIKLIIGAEFHLQDELHVVLLARNREGYAQLASLITTARRRAAKGHYELHSTDLDHSLADCLLLVITTGNEAETAQLITLQQHFNGRLWLVVEHHYLAGEMAHIEKIRQLGKTAGIPLVACGNVHMHRRGRRALQDVLTSIRLNIPLRQAGYALFPNGERHLRSLPALQSLYEPNWLEETIRIADLCHFSLDELRYEYPAELVPANETADSYLHKLTRKGLRQRWPQGAPLKVRQQVEHELQLIAELRYAHYFLTVHDIVEFARRQDILCQGRGSAANSAVCYCLGITAVDPARVNMLFERFISKERNEPPDIDVDFENSRREEVMQYIYRKYGRHRAALTATLITYRRKSALRDIGKALGLSLDQIDRLIGTLAWWDKGIPEERLREAGFSPDNAVIRQLLVLTQELLGFPRHLSQHVGGFLIAQDDLSRLVPVENASMQDRTVIQWDKNDLDALGLLKIDCLALGMLSAIHRSFDLLRQHCNLDYQLADIPAEDPAVYRMMQRADTIGVFQIESRAQMNMLPRLKPANYYDLVVQIAIVRPGPIQGDMVHPYLRRRRGEEVVEYPSPEVEQVLQRTLGIPIFQEQVIELAMVAAGFSGGEADQLRRAIGSWRSVSQLELFRHKLLQGMVARGYSQTFAEQIFNQIRGFGEYGFPESHSASFALLAYVSAWLKHYHPAVFTCALLNSLPMGFYSASQLIQDVRRHHVEVRPVDINHSHWESTLEPGRNGRLALRLGMHRVKHLSRQGAEKLLEARRQQPFSDLQALYQRCQPEQRDLDALAAADALRSLAGHRHQARWETLGCETLPGLFSETGITEIATELPFPAEGEEIVADYGSTGLSLRRHPLALLRPRFDRQHWLSIRAVANKRSGSRIRLAGLVSNRQHPGSAKGTIFLTLEDETGNINIIVWSCTSQKYRREVLQGRLLMVSGKVEREGIVVHVIADTLRDCTPWLGALETQSRDFH